MGHIDVFRPDQYEDSLADIDLSALSDQGIRCLILDLDNTLLPWNNGIVPQSTRDWILQAKNMGFGMCILSNTHSPSRLTAIAGELDIDSYSRALKPRRSAFDMVAADLKSPASAIAVIGDQLLTDIWGGNLAGMHTILVKPMSDKEFFGTKISRVIERGILRKLMKRGSFKGTNSGQIESDKLDGK